MTISSRPLKSSAFDVALQDVQKLSGSTRPAFLDTSGRSKPDAGAAMQMTQNDAAASNTGGYSNSCFSESSSIQHQHRSVSGTILGALRFGDSVVSQSAKGDDLIDTSAIKRETITSISQDSLSLLVSHQHPKNDTATKQTKKAEGSFTHFSTHTSQQRYARTSQVSTHSWARGCTHRQGLKSDGFTNNDGRSFPSHKEELGSPEALRQKSLSYNEDLSYDDSSSPDNDRPASPEQSRSSVKASTLGAPTPDATTLPIKPEDLGSLPLHTSSFRSPTSPPRRKRNAIALPTHPQHSLGEITPFSSAAMSNKTTANQIQPRQRPQPHAHAHSQKSGDLSSGVLPEVLMTMREKIESLSLFDSDIMRLTQPGGGGMAMPTIMTGGSAVGFASAFGNGTIDESEEDKTAKDSLQRSFQQSISAAVLVSLAHKRYERRRLAAMEIEKIVRSLVTKREFERVRAILLLLSDDYVRSTSEDARKGGVVALAACQIGLKKGDDRKTVVVECKDLILASVVHACQDPSSRVRYYATESLFNVVKVVPVLAVQYFFILFEILRSLYADVDHDVRSGAQLLDKKLKEILVGAINGGTFVLEQCTPLFVRFVYMKNKPTKRLTLTWLQEFSDKLIGNPLLEFVHLFLGGVFSMIADPSSSIRQLALGFLHTALPKLLASEDDSLFEDGTASFHKVDFDRILQSLVTIMEHPDPFVRKVAMFWTSQIIKAHVGIQNGQRKCPVEGGATARKDKAQGRNLSAASISVRNSLPHVLPGILLSIGDAYNTRATNRDTYLFASQTTQSLAEQTNLCLQRVVSNDGAAFVVHLDGFIVTLLEELDTAGGLGSRNASTEEREPYRVDVKADGSGIEGTGWFRAIHGDDAATDETKSVGGEVMDNNERSSLSEDDMVILSRLCALQWISVLYDSVVPHAVKGEYAKEFIPPILHQLIHNPPNVIVYKSFEVLAKITVPVKGEHRRQPDEAQDGLSSLSNLIAKQHLDALSNQGRTCVSRNRLAFTVLIRLFSRHHRLLSNVAKIIQFMCTLQPPEFVFVSFASELGAFTESRKEQENKPIYDYHMASEGLMNCPIAGDLEFVSCFVQQMNMVLLTAKETYFLRSVLKDSIGPLPCMYGDISSSRRQSLFYVLFYSFAHNFSAAISLCFWSGAYRTASLALWNVNPMDINLTFYLEADQFIELVERPLFRHLQFRMLENGRESNEEGDSAVLFRALTSLLMLLPQSSSYSILKDRLLTIAKFRQASIFEKKKVRREPILTPSFSSRFEEVRMMHCNSKWRIVRHESLEISHGNCRFGNDGDPFLFGDVGCSQSRDYTLTRISAPKSQPARIVSDVEKNKESDEVTDTSTLLSRKSYSQPGEGVGTNKWKDVWSPAKTPH